MLYYLKNSGAREVSIRRIDETRMIPFHMVSFLSFHLFAIPPV